MPTKKQPVDPLFSDDDVKLWSTGTVGQPRELHYAKLQIYKM